MRKAQSAHAGRGGANNGAVFLSTKLELLSAPQSNIIDNCTSFAIALAVDCVWGAKKLAFVFFWRSGAENQNKPPRFSTNVVLERINV
jgi:heme/copper-type cytochrome/quinol oxidase subunit 2